MKKILSLIIGVTFIIASGKEGEIGFRYGFLSKPSLDSDSVSVLSDSSHIHTGDYLQINIGHLRETNICVIYKSAEGEYLLLHNKEKSADDNGESLPDTTYFTAFHWGNMGPPSGIETFYFINSFNPLTELTKLVDRYVNAPPKGQIKLAKRIQDKIDVLDPDIHDDLISITSRLDKPIAGGVAFRGDDDGFRDISVTHECLGTGGIAFQKIVLIHQ